MKKLLLAGVAGLAFSTQAAAQDFGGLRVEGRVGYQSVNLEADFDDEDELGGDESEGGLAYGAEVGFDVQAGPGFVVGAYAGYALSDVERCAEIFGDDEGCLEAGRTITAGVRAGVPLGTSALLYGKLGYSNTRIRVRYDDFDDIIDDFSLSEEGDGWHAGGGIELGFGRNFYGKAEYVFTNSSGNFNEAGASGNLDADRHEFVAGLGIRF
jgi:outer membrane immunogenic protein